MNKIKSLFIGIFPMFAMGISGYSLYQLSISGMNFIWLGVVLITLPIMLFISRIMMFKDMARTSAHFPLLTVLAVIGLILAIYGYVQSNFTHQSGMVLASTGFVLFLLYNFWYSVLGRSVNSVLQIGRLLPGFILTTSDGKTIHSDTFTGTPSVLIFFRGNWCPLCVAQIKEMATKYQELSASGAKIAFIAPQPEKNTQALAVKFNVPFIFLTDIGNRAAQALGIEMKNGLPTGMEMLGYNKDTVYPTVIITDAQGQIIYSDCTNNYRVRPEPEAFIKVLNDHAQMA